MTRTVTVALRASNSQYNSAMTESAAKTTALGEATKRAGSSAALQSKAFTTAGRSVFAAGALMEGAFLGASKAAMDFNAAMSQVKTLSHATGVQMTYLRDAAEHMGTAIGYSATQTADAETELIKAGIGVSDIMSGALKGSLALAAAGQIDVGQATEIATIAMTQFKLAGSDIPHVADLLAAGADKALGGVDELGQALKSGGLVAAQFGLSIEDTIGTLASFANAGLMGEAAGTDLRQMLLKLAAPSKQSKETMDQLGISVYDAGGRFVGMTNLAGQLHDKLGALTQAQRDHALAVMFGARAIVGANILYNGGAAGLQDWISKVNDSGFAMQQASGKMDNLKGDLNKLGAAFRTDLIDSGSSANGVLREGAQAATEALKAYGALPHQVQGTVTAIAGIGGAISIAGGTFLLAVPKIAAFKTALEDMGPRTQRFGKAVLGVGNLLTGPYGAALGLAVVGLGLYGHAKAEAAAKVDQFTQAILADSGAIGENTRKTAIATLEKEGLLKTAQSLNISMQTVTDAALGNRDAMTELMAGVLAAKNAQGGLSADQVLFVGRLGEVTKATEGGVAAAKRQQEALGGTASAAGAAGTALDGTAASEARVQTATEKAVAALKEQSDRMRAMYDPIFAMRKALQDETAAQAALTKAVHEHGSKSAQAKDAQFGLLQSTVDLKAATLALSSGMRDHSISIGKVKASLAEMVAQHLISKATADALAAGIAGVTHRASELSKTPAVAHVKADGTEPVSHALDGLQAKLDRIDGETSTARVNLVVNGINTLSGLTAKLNRIDDGANATRRAAGGFVHGPAHGQSDEIKELRPSSALLVQQTAEDVEVGTAAEVDA